MRDTSSTSGAWSKSFATHLRWIRRHRLAWLALAGGISVFATDQRSIVAGLIAWLMIALMFGASRGLALVGCGITLTCSWLHHARMEKLAEDQRRVEGGVWMDFRAQVIESPRLDEDAWRCLAKVTQNSRWSGRSERLFLYGRGSAPQWGQIIEAHGRWEPIAPPRNEGEFDRAAHMRRLGVMAECSIAQWQPLAQPHTFWRWTAATQHSFERAITRGLETGSDEAKVILAMVMGKQPAYDDDVVEPFRQTGTLHLFSVSGQHVNLVALILWGVLRICRIPRRTAIFLLIPAIFCYAWVTGASPPAVRAAWMAALFLAAFLAQRKADLTASLAVVFLTALFIDSNLLFLPGVQLSYGIVAIISIGLSLSHDLLERMSWNDDYLPRELQTSWQTRCGEIWQRFLQSLVISTSAFIGSTPLTISYFSLITPVSILTNLALTPLVAGLLGLSLFAAVIAPFSQEAAEKSNQLNARVARACIRCSRFFSDLPGAHATITTHKPTRDTIRIYDLPRGGGAALIQADGSDALLDTGNAQAFRRIVLPSLRYFGSQPYTLFLSHPEAAHMGGATLALKQLPLRQIISPVALAKTPSFRSLTQEADFDSVPIYHGQADVRITQNKNVFWENVLSTDPWDIHRIADDRHAIHLLHFHGFRLLFLHDAGAMDLAALSRRLPDLRCDVMIMGRHSLHPVVLGDAIKMFTPAAIIATHADFPESERIPDAWLRRVEKTGISIFHQGHTGMVTLEITPDGSLSVEGFLNHARCLLPSHR
jgi:ComEC/Rec2-related protein